MIGVAGFVLWAALATLLPHGLPLGIVGLGVVTGALASFTALGLVLVYRSCRIVNFAQAEIGGVAAGVSVLLVTHRGFSYFVAVPIGMAIAVLSGALIELTVVRRFFHAPRLVLTVATIGLAQILAGAILFLPSLLPAQDSSEGLATQFTRFTTPFAIQYEISPVLFNGDHLVALLAVVGVLVGLVWLFNRTDTGIGVRGAADSQERALLLGIPVRRLSFVTWVVASGLSGLSGILSAGVLGSNGATGGGPSVLLAPLAAAVIARFESLPVAFAASVGIGVFSQAVFWSYPRSATVDLAIFLLILVSLLLQRRKSTRVAGEEMGGLEAVREAPPLPRILRALPEVRVAKMVSLVVVAIVAVGLPLVSSNAKTILLAFIAIYAIIGVSLVVLTGWAGQVSLGQFAFVGLGAATTGSLLEHAHWDLLFCLLAASVCSAGVAVLIGIPALRVPGLFLAPVTIALAVATSSYLINPAINPTFAPLRVAPPWLFDRFDLSEPRVFYYFCLSVLTVAVLLARNFRRTRLGRAVIAARDNERFASGVSISVVRVKLIAFGFSGALAGLAGGLYVVAIRGIPFGGFRPELSLQLFTMVVVGGLTSLVGAILGALYVFSAQYLLTGAAQLFATGAGLLVVLMIAPGGLAEALYRVRDASLRRLIRQRDLDVPGFQQADTSLRDEAQQMGVALPTSASAISDGPSLILQCDDVSAGYGHLQILFGANLAVPSGAIVGLLGTNGAGKTTTLKTIAGVVPATGGRISFRGEDITHLSAIERVERGLVMVPAKGVFGSLTVRENLRLAGWVPRHGGDQAYLAETMPKVFRLFPVLEERLNQSASLLSGGEQQMLAIAQGLLARPRLLLIDELSLGLAPIVVSAILEVIRELNAAGLPIVVVEQSVNVSTTIADQTLFMEKGQIRFSGSTSELVGQDSLMRSVFFGDGNRQVDASPEAPVRGSRNGKVPSVDRRAVFSAKGVIKTYGAVTAVADLDLDIFEGQILGVIGSNGAGKTTAFDIFSGFTTPDAGELLFNGVDVSGWSAAERASAGFGRTFQDVRLLPSLTAAETIAVSLERQVEVREPIASIFYVDATARSERSIQRRVDELVDAFGLGRYRDTRIADLSTGTRRVLELACVAGHRPSLLLLDEPSSGLSQAESEEMAEILRDLAATTGATLAIIEHDVPLVAGLSDELVCMDLGRIISRGKPNAVLTDPDVVRSYLGADQDTIARSVDRPLRGRSRGTPLRAR